MVVPFIRDNEGQVKLISESFVLEEFLDQCLLLFTC